MVMKSIVKKILLIALFITLGGSAFATQFSWKVDMSADPLVSGSAATKKGGEWLDFMVAAGGDGQMHDPRTWTDPATNISFTCGQPRGKGNLFIRSGDPICNSAYYQTNFVDTASEMILTIHGAGHFTGNYRIEVLHAWNAGSISNLAVTGASSYTILQQGAVTNTTSDTALIVATQDHTIVEYTIVNDGQAVTLTWTGTARINAWILTSIIPPKVTFDSATSIGMETVSPVALTLTLDHAKPGEAYVVDYAVTGGTADGNDYTFTPGSLTFNPGETIKTFSFDIINDGITETNDETVIIGLSKTTGPNYVFGISEHVRTITEKQPEVAFASSGTSGPENVVPAIVPVKLSYASDQIVTVDYADLLTGTADSNDYTFTPDTLTFNPGETTKNISIDIIDDNTREYPVETINLDLSNPFNCSLGSPAIGTYTINDNEEGIAWEAKSWYFSPRNSRLRFMLNQDNDLELINLNGDDGFTTRIPEQRLSQAGDVAEVSYIFMTDGVHNCSDCFSCPGGCYDDDITCLAGTSDLRFALIESNGQYVQSDGGSINDIGYKLYAFRFGPNMKAQPTRWVDPCGETHKTGMFSKGDMYGNNGLMDYIPGFELTPGQYSFFNLKLERLSSSDVRLSITLNGRTVNMTDTSSTDQPQKIDVFSFAMRNQRPYTRMVLHSLVPPVCPGDFDDDYTVNNDDMEIFAQEWLKQGGLEPYGTQPNASSLILKYSFDGTQGSNITSVPNLAPGGAYSLTRFNDSGGAGVLKYGIASPKMGSGTSADFQNSSADPGTALYALDNGSNTPIDLNRAAFTIEAFIKPGIIRQSAIIRKSDISTNYWYLDLRLNNEVGFTVSGGDSYALLSGTGSIVAGTWYHVAAVFDESVGMKIYIDTVQAATNTRTTRPSDSTRALTIGCLVRDTTNPPSNSGQFFNGLIDEAKVYGHAFTLNELIYEANNGPIMVYVPLDSVANEVADDIIDLKDFSAFAQYWLEECDHHTH